LIYPNPASNKTEISSQIPLDAKALFYDMSGILVKEVQLHGKNQTIDIDSLKQGTYLFNLIGNTTCQSMKFIKKQSHDK